MNKKSFQTIQKYLGSIVLIAGLTGCGASSSKSEEVSLPIYGTWKAASEQVEDITVTRSVTFAPKSAIYSLTCAFAGGPTETVNISVPAVFTESTFEFVENKEASAGNPPHKCSGRVQIGQQPYVIQGNTLTVTESTAGISRVYTK